MEQKVKDNLYASSSFVEGLNVLVGSFDRPSGMKSACQEAALLAFFRLKNEERIGLIEEIRGAEMRGGVRKLVESAIGTKLPSEAPRLAAKVSKPKAHGKPAKPDRQT